MTTEDLRRKLVEMLRKLDRWSWTLNSEENRIIESLKLTVQLDDGVVLDKILKNLK